MQMAGSDGQEAVAERGTAPIVRRHPASEGEGGQVEGPLENEVEEVDELEGGIARDNVIPSLQDIHEMTEEDDDEEAERFFKCPVCMNVIREALVFECGHIMCVKCTNTWISTKPVQILLCPVCNSKSSHIPRKCELIEGLVRKLKLKDQTKETEKASLESHEVVGEVGPQNIQLKDVLCLSCKDILYEPSVLNCGHVFCIPCLPFTNGAIECKACGELHVSSPRICVKLRDFIKAYFPSEYESRGELNQPQTGTSSLIDTMSDDAKLSETHVGIGCDSCGVYPIQGSRYSCQSCKDFDLCDKCSKVKHTIYGRAGQVHSVDHIVKLDNTFLFDNVLTAMDAKTNAEATAQGLWEVEEEEDDNGQWPANTGGVNAGFLWQ